VPERCGTGRRRRTEQGVTPQPRRPESPSPTSESAGLTAASDKRAVRTLSSASSAAVADNFAFDLEQFESWIGAPQRRHKEFAEDAGLVEESVRALADAVGAVDDADEPGAGWEDATMRARVLGLLVADLRAEFDGLRTLAERQDATVPPEHERRVTATAQAVGRLRTRLADRAEPAWRERFAADLNGLAAALDGTAPPVEWGEVEAALSSRRDALAEE